jgi:hypothetical protein
MPDGAGAGKARFGGLICLSGKEKMIERTTTQPFKNQQGNHDQRTTGTLIYKRGRGVLELRWELKKAEPQGSTRALVWCRGPSASPGSGCICEKQPHFSSSHSDSCESSVCGEDCRGRQVCTVLYGVGRDGGIRNPYGVK